MAYSDIITMEPGKRGGKPCIRGLRLTVHDVLEYLARGMTHPEILREFPYLTEEDIVRDSHTLLIASAKWKFPTREAPL